MEDTRLSITYTTVVVRREGNYYVRAFYSNSPGHILHGPVENEEIALDLQEELITTARKIFERLTKDKLSSISHVQP